MEYIILNPTKATEEQMRAAISCNNRTYQLMNSEIMKLRRVAESEKNSVEREEPKEEYQTSLQQDQKDIDFEEEAEYYYSAIKDLSKDNLETELIDALPSRKNYQYQRIVLRIKAEIMRSIKELKDFFESEDLSKEDAEEFKEELLFETEKIAALNRAIASQQEQSEETLEQEENTLIFVPTPGGNIRVLEEMEHIDPEYYDRFYGLFQSIADGTFKNVKRFAHNSDLAGLCEVKDFKTRVVFKRLNKNTYAVISAFIKKSDNDKGYRNMLSIRYADYLGIESSLVSNLGNEEFIQLHNQYQEELFRKINRTEKAPSIVKTMGGE